MDGLDNRFAVKGSMMKNQMITWLRGAGELLRERFGGAHAVRRKEGLSSVVTDVDVAAERWVVDQIRDAYPGHNILAEESGFANRGAEYTWVIDPLDGTSNFVAGLPWFGVMIALFRGNRPVLGGMYLPVEDALYVAEENTGATRCELPVRVTGATELSDVLFAYAADAGGDAAAMGFQTELYGRLLNQARNVRSTNSLVDFALVIDGRLGGVINHATRIWDIAAPWLILREAGGLLTDLRGDELTFSLGADACSRNYAVLGANPILHGQVRELAVSAAAT
jgi:myo-inositol-1(or 4)-monophosphatase